MVVVPCSKYLLTRSGRKISGLDLSNPLKQGNGTKYIKKNPIKIILCNY